MANDMDNMNEELEIIELMDDDGKTIHCLALGTFEADDSDRMYCAFVEVDEAGNESDDVIILRAEFVDETKEMLDLFPVEDEKELDAAYKKFLELSGEDD